MEPARGRRRHVGRIGRPAHRLSQSLLCIQRSRRIEYHQLRARHLLFHHLYGATKFGCSILMHKGALHAAIQIMSRHVLEGRITQIHAHTLQSGNFHHVGIMGGKINPLLYRGTITQGLFGLRRHKQGIRFVREHERSRHQKRKSKTLPHINTKRRSRLPKNLSREDSQTKFRVGLRRRIAHTGPCPSQ